MVPCPGQSAGRALAVGLRLEGGTPRDGTGAALQTGTQGPLGIHSTGILRLCAAELWTNGLKASEIAKTAARCW